jgi:heterodisulfide reductase subunit A
MKKTNKHVTVVGGGVAGLATALDLAESGISVDVLEKAAFMGGHAVNFTCKATDACVKCGACMVETVLEKAVHHPHIQLQTGCRLEQVQTADKMSLEITQAPQFIDPEACDNCGACHADCPEDAILQGTSPHQIPFYALEFGACRRQKGETCTACSDACPQNAIDLEKTAATTTCQTDALVMATGFEPFDPKDKPYGYGVFQNVVTNLDLEKQLRRTGRLMQPSDQSSPASVAFIQCVGSRDAKLGHLWCSRVCCGSALRMARLLKDRQPETEISVFYIDIQSFGRDFESFYHAAGREFRFQRSIPGDIIENADHTLTVFYVDDHDHTATEESFDMVVLSVGMLPNTDALKSNGNPDLQTTAEGFLAPSCSGEPPASNGVFSAGSATGPMGIAESIASAGQTASAVISYLNLKP